MLSVTSKQLCAGKDVEKSNGDLPNRCAMVPSTSSFFFRLPFYSQLTEAFKNKFVLGNGLT